MDPNTNLREQLSLAHQLAECEGDEDGIDAARLAELVVALDGWIRNGGFLPDAWRR